MSAVSAEQPDLWDQFPRLAETCHQPPDVQRACRGVSTQSWSGSRAGNICNMCLDCQMGYPLPQRRSLRMRMKRDTPRKKSSSERININRFWNEMEEFLDKLENDNFITTTFDCDEEIESVFSARYSAKVISEDEDDNVSCYCSRSSCYSSRAESVSSNSSTPGQLSQDIEDDQYQYPLLYYTSNHSALPLPPGSNNRLPLPPIPLFSYLPLPPSMHSTRDMLYLMDRMDIDKLDTLV